MSMQRSARCFTLVLLWVLAMPSFAEDRDSGKAVRAMVGADGKQRVEILGGSYFFKPDHIIVKVNVPEIGRAHV